MAPSSIFKVFYFYSASILRSFYLSFWSLSFWQSLIRTLVILLSSPGCSGRSPHLKILTVTTSAKSVWPCRQHFYRLPGLGLGHYSANHRGYCLETKPCLTLCNPTVCKTLQASQSFIVSCSLLKFMSIESVMPSNHLILRHPLLLPPSVFTSIRVFSNESLLHIRWPKYRSFSFSISPSSEYSGLISFSMNLSDLLAVQRTLKSLLQHHIQKHQFFSAQLFW